MGSKGCKLDYEGAICSCGYGCKYRDEHIATLEARVKELEDKGVWYQKRCDWYAGELELRQAWVDDLQAGMYINCIYCGHRYGPDTEVTATMADILKEHIEQCPKHPMSEMLYPKPGLFECYKTL